MLEKKTFYQAEKMYFQQKSSKVTIRNFSKYIVTEIEIFLECFVLKGMSFTIATIVPSIQILSSFSEEG